MISLPYTGERLIPDRFHIQDRLLQEHLDRYRYAARRIREEMGDRQDIIPVGGYPLIIDAPCGVGYGAALMAEQCHVSVLAIDSDVSTIEYAKERYGVSDINVDFEVEDLESTFDSSLFYAFAVTCFEGIEHVTDQENVARKLCDALRPGGLIFVSTPRIHGPGSGSEYHTRELTRDELVGLFAPYLSDWEVVGQELRVGDCVADDNARFYMLVGRKSANISS